MIFFLLWTEANLTRVARVYKGVVHAKGRPLLRWMSSLFYRLLGPSPSAWPSRWLPHASGGAEHESTVLHLSMDSVHC